MKSAAEYEARLEEYGRAGMKEWYRLTNLPGIGRKRIEILRSAFDNIIELYELEKNIGKEKADEKLVKIFEEAGMTDTKAGIQTTVRTLLDEELRKKADIEYEKILHSDVRMVSVDSADYPEKLRDIFDVPYILYYKGSLPDKNKHTAAMVGARACSEYGRRMAKDIAHALAVNDVQIVSGFARGIDTAAHTGCLSAADGRTFAVFGSGINYCYPPENRFTYDEIIERGGGIISEYPPDMKPVPGFFPMRNRIISGLSDVVLVLEAGKKSGSLITADHAMEQGRTVMALPGRVTDSLSAGCNGLIREGAAVITGMEDIFFELGISPKEQDKFEVKKEKNQIELANAEKMLYSHLDFNPQGIDDLIRESKLSPEVVSGCLVRLELAGLAKRTGGMYVRGK